MLYNKNRFKKVNVKKVLHKVKKQWVTISIALLGLLGVKSVATHVNVNADVNSANNDQANHQLKSDQLQSGSSTLVQSNGASLISASANSSASSVAAPSASVSASSVNSTSASQGNRNYQLTVSSAAQHRNASQALNVPSAAQSVHNDVLNGYANQAQSDYSPVKNLGLTRVVHHMLGEQPVGAAQKAQTPNTNSNLLSNLLNPDTLLSLADANKGNAAYSSLMNTVGSMASMNFYTSSSNVATPFSKVATTIDDVDSDVKNLSGNNLNALQNSLDSIKGKVDLARAADGSKPVMVDKISHYIKMANTIFGSNTVTTGESAALGSAIDDLAKVQSNQSAKNSYSNAFSTLASLQSDNSSEQASALSTAAGDLKDVIKNASLSSGDSFASPLNNFANNASQKATSIDNTSAAYSDLLNSYEGPLFSDMVNRITASGFNSGAFNTLVSNAKNDLKNASTASAFINDLADQDGAFDGVTAKSIKNDLSGFANNPELNKAYSAASADPSDADQILTDLTNLRSNNEAGTLDNIASIANSHFSSSTLFGQLSNYANSIIDNSQAASNNESTAVNNLVSGLPASAALSFVASKFASNGFNEYGKFDHLFSQAEDAFDNNNASNASEFLHNFAGQAKADFPAADDGFINTALNSLESNSAVSDAYSMLRDNRAATKSILNDFATMTPENESNALGSIASTIKATSSFSNNSAISNVADLVTSAATSTSTSEASNYSNLLKVAEGPLFSAMVNRIVANGFKSGAFKDLVSDAKSDLTKAPTASAFINDLTSQDGAFDGATAKAINNYLSGYANNPELNSAYSKVSANSSATDNILNELSGMNSNNEADELGSIASNASTNFSDSALFGSLANNVSRMQNSVESNAYQNFLKNNEASLFSAVVNRITASNFNSGAFTSLVNAVEGDLANASTASDFAKSMSGQTNSFTDSLTNSINSYVSSFANNPYVNTAYQTFHNDTSDANRMLGDLSNMANQPSNEANDLNDIASVAKASFSNASSFGNLASDASSMYKSVSSAANNKGNGGKKTPAKPTYSAVNAQNMMWYLLKQITKPGFKPDDFNTLISKFETFMRVDASLGLKTTYSNSLPKVWSYVTNNVKFRSYGVVNLNDPIVSTITKMINDPVTGAELNIIYTKFYNHYNKGDDSKISNFSLLTDLKGIADHNSDKKSVNYYLNDPNNETSFSNIINHDSVIRDILNSIDTTGSKNTEVDNIDEDINGLNTTPDNVKHSKSTPKNNNGGKKTNNKGNNNKPNNPNKTPNKPKKPNTPNKKPSNDTNLVDKAININTVKALADNLASSKAPANLSDIVNNLEALPNQPNTVAFDGKLNNIISDLSGDKVSLVTNVLTDIDDNASVNKLSDPEKTLVKDFNAGIQYLKNGGQNAVNDYDSVLNDLLDIKNHPSHEDHDLSNIAKTINKGQGNLNRLHVLKLFASAAHQAAKKDYQPIKANNRKQQKQDAKRHASYVAAKIQQKKDAQRHNQILADKAQHDKDTQRHNHIENMSAVAEADSAARAATVYYRKDSMAAASAQKFAKGLNPGSDSKLASDAASTANKDASLAGIVEAQAESADQQARSDVNDYNAVHTDAKTASEGASAAYNLFSGISDQLMSASTDATAAGYNPNSSSTSTNSSSASSSASSTNSNSATSNSSSASSTNSSTASNSASTSASASNSTSTSTSTNSSSTGSSASSSASSSAPSSSASSSSVAPSSSASVPASSSNAQSYVPSSTVTPSYTPNVPSSNNNYFPMSNSAVQPTSNDLTVYNSSSAQSSSVSAESSSAAVEMTSDTEPNQLSIGQAFESNGAVVARVAPQKHWFNIVNTCLAHNHIGSVGKVKDYGMVLHAGDLAQLEKVFKVTKNGKTYYRYEINVKGHDYYVTGNAKFTRKAYVQPNDMKKAKVFGRRGHHYYEARIVKPCLIHSSVHYTADNGVRSVNKDDIVRIKKAIKIGRKGFGMTRFELIDGTFVTANLDFIELI